MSQGDRTRLKRTYPYFRQRPVYVDFKNTTIFVTGSGGMGDDGASYVVLNATSSLANERVLSPGTGLTLTDNGAGSTVVIGINDSIVATVSGSTFTKLSGSLQKTAAGLSYLVAGPGISITSQSNGQIFITASVAGGSGAPTSAQYLTLAVDGTLTNERVLIAGSGITITDGGAGGAATLGINNNLIATITGSTFTNLSGSLQKTAAGLSYLAGAGSVTVTSQSNGQIIISASAGNPAPVSAQYLTLATDATLQSERVLTAGGGVTLTDAGAGSTATLGINNTVVATISGSTFTQLSGSLQRLATGQTFLAGAGSVTITTSSNGQIVISGSGGSSSSTLAADLEASYIVVGTTASLPRERALAVGTGFSLTDAGAGNNITIGLDDRIIATISGSTFTQLSGSLQKTSAGLSYLQGVGAVTITSQSNGQILISASLGNDAPVSAQYLTLATDATLQNERVLTQGSGITITDAGAGSTATLGINNNLIATISGSAFTQLSGSLQRLPSGVTYIVGQGSISVTTSSAGQVIISGSGAGGGGAPADAQYVLLSTDATLTNERVLTQGGGVTITDAGAGLPVTLGSDNRIIATISGSTFMQLSGSLQKTATGLSFLQGVGAITVTSQSNGQIVISASLGNDAPVSAQYLTLATDTTLQNERVLTQGSGITITDAGAGSTATLGINNAIIATISGSTFTQLSGSLQRLASGATYIVGQGSVSVTTSSAGQIIISGSGAGGGGAPTDAQYVLLATDTTLTNERVLTQGGGVTITDAGAGLPVTLGSDNRVLATISGSTFTQLSGSLQKTSGGLSYLVSAPGITVVSGTASSAGQVVVGFDDRIIAGVSGSTFTRLSGSLQQTAGGLSFLQGAGAITVTSQSNGQIIISASAGNDAPVSAQYLTLATDATLQNERVLTQGSGITITDAGAGSTATLGINNNLIATITGSTFTQLSGSLQRLASGITYLAGAGTVSVTTSSSGQIIISGSGTSASSVLAADLEASYILIGVTSSLPNERALAVGSGLSLTDAGAGGSVTVGINNNVVATTSGSTFTQLSGSLQRTSGGLSFLQGVGGVTVTSQSNGQILISASLGNDAPVSAQYLTLATDATLQNERVLTAGGGVTLTDAGAGSTATLGINNNLIATITGSTFTQLSGSLQRLASGVTYIVGQGSVSVTTSSAGQIIISGSSTGGTNTLAADLEASYLLLGTTASLPNERALTAGTGISLVDAGASSTATLAVKDNIVATLTGSNFSGPVVMSGTFASPFFAGVNTLLYVSPLTGQVTGTSRITLTSPETGGSAEIQSVAENASTLIRLINYAPNPNGANIALNKARGTLTSPSAVLAGDSLGSIVGRGYYTDAGGGFGATPGNLRFAADEDFTSTAFGTSFVIQLSKKGSTSSLEVFRVNGNGQFTLTGRQATSPLNTGSNGMLSLTAAAHLSQSSGVEFNDALFDFSTSLQFISGAIATQRSTLFKARTYVFNSASTITNAATVAIDRAPVAGTNATITNAYSLWVQAGKSRFDGSIEASSGLSGSLTNLTDGTSYLIAQGNISITTQSNGQIVISGSSNAADAALIFTGTWRDAGSSAYITTGSVSIDASNRAATSYGTDNFFYVSGSIGTIAPSGARRVAVFAGDIFNSGSITSTAPLFRTTVNVNNPANTFRYIITPAAIIANRILNLPLITATDTLVVTTLAQTLVGKTLTSPIINTPNFGANAITTTGAVTGLNVIATTGLTGSHTRLNSGISAFVAGSGMTITTASTNQVVFASTGGSPGGSNTYVQFNDSSTFGGNANFAFDKTKGTATITNITSSHLYVTESLCLVDGNTSTTGFIRTGYAGTQRTLWGTQDSNLADRPLLRDGGDNQYFGSSATTQVWGSIVQICDSVGTLQSEFYPGLGYIGGTPHSFDSSPGFRQASVIGSDVYFFVSGSSRVPYYDPANPTVVHPERHVAVFADIHSSGTLRFTTDPAGPSCPVISVDDGGTDYTIVEVTPASGQIFMGNSGFNTFFVGYSANLYGYSGGCSTYDGRNVLSTDLAVVSQHLSTTKTTTSSTLSNSNLTFSVNADEVWHVEIHAQCGGGAAGATIGLSGPAGCTAAGHHQSTGGANVLNASTITTMGAWGSGIGLSGARGFHAWAIITVGATAGSLTVQLASTTNAQSNSMLSGSYFRARRSVAV